MPGTWCRIESNGMPRPLAAGPGPGRRAACLVTRISRRRFLVLGHVRTLEVGVDQAQEGRHRRAPRPAVHEARASDHASPRVRAGETRTRTSRWRRRSRRRATTRCPRTTSSGRSIAAPARGGGDDTIERVVYEGYGPARRRDPGRGADRQPQPHQRRHPPHLRQARRAASASRARSPGCSRSGAWSWSTRAATREDDLIAAIDAGAEDVAADGDSSRSSAPAEDLAAVREALEAAGVEIESAELTMEPKNVVEVDGRRRRAAHAADGGPRRPRRRRGRPRQLRHPRGGAGAGRGLR